MLSELGDQEHAASDLVKAIDDSSAAGNRRRRHAAIDCIAANDELFRRASQLRPDELSIFAQRAMHLWRLGKRDQAVSALADFRRKHTNDWRALSLEAALSHSLHRDEVCRSQTAALLQLQGDNKDFDFSMSCVHALLTQPGGPSDLSAVRSILDRASAPATAGDRFLAATLRALYAVRTGNPREALRLLSGSSDQFEAQPVAATAAVVKALACQQLGRNAEARDAQIRARSILASLEQAFGRPDSEGWFSEWLRACELLREAEAIPLGRAAPRIAQTPEAEAAQRDRKVRADRARAEVAFALVQYDAGHYAEAEATLRQVIEALANLATADESHRSYRTELAAAHVVLSNVMAASGQFGDAASQLEMAVNIFEHLVAEEPGDTQALRKLAQTQMTRARVNLRAARPLIAASALSAGTALHARLWCADLAKRLPGLLRSWVIDAGEGNATGAGSRSR
jgi:tetratricopeptide (TPR) repeat protein